MALLGQFSANGGDPPGEWPDDQAVSLRLMGHELRTPLNAIMAFSTLALEDPSLEAHVADYISSSLTSADALLGVITQILEYSKFSGEGDGDGAGEMPLEMAPFTVGKMGSDLVDISGPKARARCTP